ncbi:MAG TPA: allantoate amidohydrolase [Candidatus Dormibacteraeota bacterium]|nr:allantoate amidohydrolase [Candidatus Dormibacteraeota bacterium]
MTSAATVMERCDLLAACTDEPGRITRPFASSSMREAHASVSQWMRHAGMTVMRDNIGNLRGRYEGSSEKILLLGSHLDSVRDAGRYDGPLGVIVAIAAVQRLHEAGRHLPFAIEVLAFADEEGLRFGSTYLGSRAVVGQLAQDELQRTDEGGVSMSEAIRQFGGDPARVGDDRWRGERPLGYVEVHIEQGPVLESLGLPVGVVSAIAGQDRMRVTFTGEAGHAGTVPMDRRKDALVVASMFVVAVEQEARLRPGLVATVGQLRVDPGAGNVIPGRVELSLDVRHPKEEVRLEAVQRLIADAHTLAEGRGLVADVHPISERAAVTCSPRLSSLLREAIDGEAVELASGAGHDGVYMSEITDIAMLFVRCKGGISHNPAESVTVEDVGVAIDTLSRFLELL